MKNRKHKAILCDLDETLIHNKDWQGSLDLFYSQILDGVLIDWCYELLSAMSKQGYKIVFLTARNEQCRPLTTLQLRNMLDFPFELYMREENDFREDWEIKQDHLLTILDKYDILFSLDDNFSNCDMLRKHCPTLHVV